MTALAGWVADGSPTQLQRHCALIAGGQSAYADSWTRAAACGAAFAGGGRSEQPGQSPLISGNSRYLITADIRIDNRSELTAELGIARAQGKTLLDSELVLAAWSRWQTGFLDRLAGDFTISVYDKTNRRLILARDPSGQRPCFFSHDGSRFAFASMPSGLLAHPELRRGWNLEGFRSALRDERAQPETYFCGVTRLLPGHCLNFENGKISIRRWWNPDLEPFSFSDADFVNGYREALDRAVESRLAGSQSLVGCYLSGGWDSNAVTATAARSKNVALAAFTAAPAEGFCGPTPPGYCADESGIAALAAKRYGAAHHVVRSAPVTLEFLETQVIAYQEPARNILNSAWGEAIHHAAYSLGAKVLLSGALGNLTLNYGGLPVLAQFLSEESLSEWTRQALRISRRHDVRWRGILFNSFAPLVPTHFWRSLRKPPSARGSFLHPALREPTQSPKWRQPSASTALDRIRTFTMLDHGMITKGALVEANIDERDPFADRRLIEFSLRLPPRQLLYDGAVRPLARRALADRVPVEVLDAPLKGLQSADWQNRLSRSEADRIFDSISTEPNVAEILDVKRIRGAIDRWPQTDMEVLRQWEVYTGLLPVALATGVFVKCHARLTS